ncbi:hypothetical protein O3M35_003318 [Rhynocoris fuscipes]|uniref:CCAAT-binding factor domain-containing protein n=1 Tax=Rhynocoris fuscipes TaxID=488301 RepID=A0AAW1CJN2_9HEMI
MTLQTLSDILSALKIDKNEIISLEQVFNILEGDVDVNIISVFGEIIKCLMEKAPKTEGVEGDYNEWLFHSVEKGKTVLRNITMDINKQLEVRDKAFNLLFQTLPLYVNFFNVKPKFPSHQYSELLEIMIVSDGDITFYCNILKEYMNYEDIDINFWKALDIALHKLKMESHCVQNCLNIISNVITKNDKSNENDPRPVQYYCGVKIGVTKAKDRGKHVQNVWEVISTVDIPINIRQHLLQVLLEKMILRMDKPIFLTDYFMTSLEFGGPVGILALQGIFTLIQKHNINYPNIYGKLYEMLNPSIFGTHYKARLFFLADVFLSSLHLPENLVAGFVKKFARLSLIAPPADILTLLALITNLIIRHSGLKKLITNMEIQNYSNDPYIPTESDPSASKALESSLWEVKLLQYHVLPSVSTAAMFIDNPLPSVECDLSDLLEGDSNQIFSKELKKKIKDPPITFENPSMMSSEKGFSLWDFA